MRFFALFPLISVAAALGINCRGNTNCVGTPGALSDLILRINEIDPNQSFSTGEHITCTGFPGSPGSGPGLCVFTQDWYDGITAGEAVSMLQALSSHGCSKCGSIPFLDNEVKRGQLTVNWVSNI